MQLTRRHPFQRAGLHASVLRASVAVVVCTALGLAMISDARNVPLTASDGIRVQSGSAPEVGAARTTSTFQCAECGVIESIRQIERTGSLASASLVSTTQPTIDTRATAF